MLTFVISCDPQRFVNLRTVLGMWHMDPTLWPAVVPPLEVGVRWRGGDQQVKTAILRSHRTLAEHLTTLDADRYLVLQDDAPITSDPHRPNAGPIHVYAGYRRNPQIEAHVCPKAFSITPAKLPALIRAWSDETRPACYTFPHVLDQETTYG
jgi:hypothetical protein